MRQRPESFKAADEDPEATLVTPRFDADDARRAHPVVPFAEATRSDAPRTARLGRPRRSWTPALFAVALLAVAALGGAVATKVWQSPREQRLQEQTQAASAQAAEAPPQPSTPTAGETPREDAPTAGPETRAARTRRARPAAATLPAAAFERDEAEGRRGKALEKRREHEDDLDKEMRKALKRAKGKAPRLVDILTSP